MVWHQERGPHSSDTQCVTGYAELQDPGLISQSETRVESDNVNVNVH